MDAAAFQARTGVSRETLDRLEVYADLLTRWQVRINLVGRATLDDLWHRHFLDSAQLWPLIPAPGRLVDLGSGAGFPGLVLAAMGLAPVHLVERDARKAVFLREAARAMRVTVQVHAVDAGTLKLDPPADIVTARALASLPALVALARPLASPDAVGLFLKGRSAREELAEAGLTEGGIDLIPSVTDPDGVVVRLRNLGRA